MDEDILLQVMKPGRYIGREWNAAKKDFNGITFALCFPDMYEVGMSNLGMRILYGVINAIEGCVCDRFFAPAPDMEEKLRGHNLRLVSLEHKKELRQFDIVGFSLAYELCYTNVLAMLELGGVGLTAHERSNLDPIVIGGGTCALNPEPIADFFDLFIIGEAEEAMGEVIAVLRKHRDAFKSEKISRRELLALCAGIEGVYVPSLYEVCYGSDGALIQMQPKAGGCAPLIKKRFVKDLDASFFPVDWLVPFIEIIHDRVTLEIMRGCPGRCHFCQARVQYYPVRRKSPETVMGLAQAAYAHSGYEEMSLIGLSVSDYPHIEELVVSLIALFKGQCVSFSLPSLKPRDLVGNLSTHIASIKKTGLTFAPEAGTERMRRILNKQFEVATFLQVMADAYRAGYQRVKLYFMIGLPGEREEDLDGILDLAAQISDLRKGIARFPAEVSVSINTLIPKPHTPLQWLAMEDTQSIIMKQEYLRKKNKNKRLTLRFQDWRMTYLEGILSRGDRRLSPVIRHAFASGARFDAWDNHFVFEKWTQAFEACRIQPERFLRAQSLEGMLPWDFLNAGVDKDSLRCDFDTIRKAVAGSS